MSVHSVFMKVGFQRKVRLIGISICQSNAAAHELALYRRLGDTFAILSGIWIK
jgi:hypothetical protein